MNEWLRGLAFSRGLTFVDYGMVLADPDGGMRADLGNDGVHPNRLGYARMGRWPSVQSPRPWRELMHPQLFA